MKLKLIRCVGFVLWVCTLAFCESAFADNGLPSLVFLTNTQTIYSDPTIVTNWSDIKVPLYQNSETATQLNAKWIRIGDGTNSSTEENIVALVDPETGNSWVGSLGWYEPYFFLETETNIICGGIMAGATALGRSGGGENVFNGAAASVDILWDYSYIPNLKPGNKTTDAIEKLTDEIKEYGSWRKLSYKKFFQQRKATALPVSKRGENGLNPWLFLPNQTNNFTTIEGIEFKNGILRLDLKGPDGVHPTGESGIHTARAWIDVKTLKVTKIIQDNKP